MFSRQRSQIRYAIYGICWGIIAVSLAALMHEQILIYSYRDYIDLYLERVGATGGMLVSGLLIGLMLRNNHRIVLFYTSAILMLAIVLNDWYAPVRMWGLGSIPPLVAGPIGMVLSQIFIRIWRTFNLVIPPIVPVIAQTMILITGFWSAIVYVTYYIDPDDSIGPWLKVSSTVVYVLATVVVIYIQKKETKFST